jgi:hypothetical protein
LWLRETIHAWNHLFLLFCTPLGVLSLHKAITFCLLSLFKKMCLWGDLALCIWVWLYPPTARTSEALTISLWSLIGTSYLLNPSERHN